MSSPSHSPQIGILDAIKQSFLEIGINIGQFLPNLVIAMILLLVGVLVAKVTRAILTKTLVGIKFDTLLEKTGIRPVFMKMGLVGSPSTGIPKIAQFFILFMTIRVAATSAGFTEIANIIDLILAFLPKITIAFIIMVIGFLAGDFIQTAVFNALDAKGLDYAHSLSRICFGFIFIIFLTVALSQIGIQTDLLKDSVKIILIGLALAAALALGLGLKGHASNIVAAVYVRDIYRKGTEIEIEGVLLKIKGIGPVTTKLENQEGGFLIVPNSALLTGQIKGKSSNK